MQSEIPKQYLPLADKTVLEHTLQRFIDNEKINGIVVVLNKQDPWWQDSELAVNNKITTTTGGIERCHSVLNGLFSLHDRADKNDWVLVHDAARPCLTDNELERLLTGIGDHPVGGLLALPVRDTMKRSQNGNEIAETIEREGLWHAMTPQMFRYQKLVEALSSVVDQQKIVTDEAQAMELTGVNPLLVKAEVSNIKITQMGDLELANFYINRMGAGT